MLIWACILSLFPIFNLFILHFTKIWIDKGLESLKTAMLGPLPVLRTVPWGRQEHVVRSGSGRVRAWEHGCGDLVLTLQAAASRWKCRFLGPTQPSSVRTCGLVGEGPLFKQVLAVFLVY